MNVYGMKHLKTCVLACGFGICAYEKYRFLALNMNVYGMKHEKLT